MGHVKLFVVAILLFVSASALTAQGMPTDDESQLEPPVAMFGYVVNGPNQFLGVGAAVLPPFLGRWGLYVDYKTIVELPFDERKLGDRTAEEADARGDVRRALRDVYTSYNAAVTFEVGPQLMVYAGGGVTDQRIYGEFVEVSETSDTAFEYWAKYENSGGLLGNLMGGLFFRLNPLLSVQFGAESTPAGMTVGLHLTL